MNFGATNGMTRKALTKKKKNRARKHDTFFGHVFLLTFNLNLINYEIRSDYLFHRKILLKQIKLANIFSFFVLRLRFRGFKLEFNLGFFREKNLS